MYNYHCAQCGADFASEKQNPEPMPCPNCGLPLACELPAGYRLGGFEIIRRIGAGSTGTVYLANQLSMDRAVAVKVLYGELTKDREALCQFMEEIRTLGQIQHPNIVSAFESGEDNGLYFLAMQFVPGRTLDLILNESAPLSVQTSIGYAKVIAEALRSVWNKFRLCHRDVKPGNIIISDDGEPVLLDFGTAIRRGENSVRNGKIEGSPYYMSPEQARGEQLTFHSDMYSLGASLYHMLVGVPPYDDPDVMEILRKHNSAPFPEPEQRNPAIRLDPKLVSLLRRMLAKTPVDRFASWDDLLDAMDKLLLPLPEKKKIAAASAAPKKILTVSRPHGPAPKKKSSWIAAANLLLLCLLALGGAGYYYMFTSETNARNALNSARSVFEDVKQKDYDPAAAKQKFETAVELSKKFGVKPETLHLITSESEQKMRELDILIREQKAVETFCRQGKAAVKASRESHPELENLLKKKVEILSRIEPLRAAMLKVVTDIESLPVSLPGSKEKEAQVLMEIRAELAALNSLHSSVKNPVAETEKKESAAEEGEEDSSEASGDSEETVESAKADKSEDGETTESDRAENARKALAKYKSQIRKEKNQAGYKLVLAVRNRDFDAGEKLLVFPDRLAPKDDFQKAEAEAYQHYLSVLKTDLQNAKKVFKNISKDVVDRKKALLRQPGFSVGERFSAFFLCGYFAEAKKLLPPDRKDDFSSLLSAYLTPRVKRAVEAGKTGDLNELKVLDEDYGGLEEYQKIINSVRSRKK